MDEATKQALHDAEDADALIGIIDRGGTVGERQFFVKIGGGGHQLNRLRQRGFVTMYGKAQYTITITQAGRDFVAERRRTLLGDNLTNKEYTSILDPRD